MFDLIKNNKTNTTYFIYSKMHTVQQKTKTIPKTCFGEAQRTRTSLAQPQTFCPFQLLACSMTHKRSEIALCD